MPEAPRPDWRNADANAKVPDTSESRSWKAKSSNTGGAKMPSRRFRRRAIVFTCVLSLAVGIGFLLSFIKSTRPACLVVIGSGYEHNLLLPPNVHGWNGGVEMLKSITTEEESAFMAWFREFFGQRSGIRRTNTVPLSDWSATWREISHRINAGDAKEQVILYVSAHGYADEIDAYLLRDATDIKSAEDFNAARVPFSALLASLKKDVPEEKAIVVILDVCHAQSNWSIGMLQNDFVERVKSPLPTFGFSRRHGKIMRIARRLRSCCWLLERLTAMPEFHRTPKGLEPVTCISASKLGCRENCEELRP